MITNPSKHNYSSKSCQSVWKQIVWRGLVGARAQLTWTNSYHPGPPDFNSLLGQRNLIPLIRPPPGNHGNLKGCIHLLPSIKTPGVPGSKFVNNKMKIKDYPPFPPPSFPSSSWSGTITEIVKFSSWKERSTKGTRPASATHNFQTERWNVKAIQPSWLWVYDFITSCSSNTWAWA